MKFPTNLILPSVSRSKETVNSGVKKLLNSAGIICDTSKKNSKVYKISTASIHIAVDLFHICCLPLGLMPLGSLFFSCFSTASWFIHAPSEFPSETQSFYLIFPKLSLLWSFEKDCRKTWMAAMEGNFRFSSPTNMAAISPSSVPAVAILILHWPLHTASPLSTLLWFPMYI